MAELREAIADILAQPDHSDCRSAGPDHEADCIIEGLRQRGAVPEAGSPDLRAAFKRLFDFVEPSLDSLHSYCDLDKDYSYARCTCGLDDIAEEVRAALGDTQEPRPDLDVERLREAYHVEYTSGDNRCEHGARWDCRDRAEETVHWDRLARAAASPAAPETPRDEPEPNRTGMPKCPVCGDIAYRPEPVVTRQQAWRCGGCHRTLSRCSCPEGAAPETREPRA